MRSAFTIEQFETAFQKHAYKIALDALQKLPTQPEGPYTNLQIEAAGSKLHLISTSEETIKFEAGIFYSKNKGENITFTIEEKLYSQSNHSTKISFYGLYGSSPKEIKNYESKILAIIDELMVGIKPIPRFALSRTK